MGNGCRSMCMPRVQDPELNDFYSRFRDSYTQSCKSLGVPVQGAYISSLLKYLRIPTWPRSQRSQPPRVLVNWANTPCGEPALIAFVQTLRKVRTSVRFGLNMKSTQLNDRACAMLIGDLPLFHLDLSGNEFSDEGLLSIARMLATNDAIRVLHLSGPSKFSAKSVEAFASALQKNTTLKKVALHGLNLDDSSLKRLAAVFSHNSSIQDVDISANPNLTYTGISALVRAVSDNHALTCLKIDSACLDPASGASLRRYIERNLICTDMMQMILGRAFALTTRTRASGNKKGGLRASAANNNRSGQNGGNGAPNENGNGSNANGMAAASPSGARAFSQDYAAEAAFHDDGEGGELETDLFWVGHAETIGRRPTMEDVSVVELCYRGNEDEALFELFDGHGGRTASTLAGTWMHEIISETLDTLEQRLQQQRINSPAAQFQGISQNMQPAAAPVTMPLTANALKTFNAAMESMTHEQLLKQQRVQRDRGLVGPDGQMVRANNGLDLVSDVLTTSFLDMNDVMIQHDVSDGTTGLVVYIRGNRMWVANAGDSRAVLSRNGHATRLSVDHVPVLPEEEARIEKYGGFVSNDGRINGVLAVSRALGDLFLQPMVSPEPYTFTMELKPSDNLIVMACDGLWDVMDDQYAVDVARSIEDPRRAAVRLRDLAYQTGSTDNISVTVVRIKPANGKPSPAVAFARQRRRSLNSSISLSSSPRRSVADGDEAKMQAHEEQQTVFSVGEPEERDEDLDGSQ